MKTIERIFESAKNIDTPEFPFSDEELRSVLKKETEAGESQKSNNIFRKLGALKMSLISLAIVGTSLGVLFMSQPQANDPISGVKEIKTAANVQNSPTNNAKTLLADAAAKGLGAKRNSNPVGKAAVNHDIAINSVKEDKHDNAPDYNYEVELFELSDAELAKLNVLHKGDAFLIELEDKIYHKVGITERAELNDNGYPEKGIKRHVTALYPFGSPTSPRALRKYAGWDMDKTAGIFPITIMSESYDGDRLGISRTQGGIPAFEPNLEEAVAEQHFDGIGRKILAARRKDASLHSLKIKVDDPSIVSKFFPVYIPVKNSEGKDAHILLWYPVTSRTIDALPDRYKAKVQGKLLVRDEDLSQNLCESEFLRNNPDLTLKEDNKTDAKQVAARRNKYAGIAKIELTPEELRNLGVNLNDENLTFQIRDKVELSELPTRGKAYFANLGYDTAKSKMQIRGAYKFQFDEVKKGNFDGLVGRGDVDKYTGWSDDDWALTLPIGVDYNANMMKATVNGKDTADRNIYTIANNELFYNPKVSNLTGENDPLETTDNYQSFPKVSRLLPISVVYKFDQNNNSGKVNINLWYYMTKELAERLPERYKTPILKELELAKAIENGQNPESACGELNSKTSYLGICNLQNGGIKIQTIYPNPVKDGKINIGFELKKASKITISLADYTGAVKEVLVDNKDYNSGSIATSLPVKTEQGGVYLLIINDESGATAIERIIIK